MLDEIKRYKKVKSSLLVAIADGDLDVIELFDQELIQRWNALLSLEPADPGEMRELLTFFLARLTEASEAGFNQERIMNRILELFDRKLQNAALNVDEVTP